LEAVRFWPLVAALGRRPWTALAPWGAAGSTEIRGCWRRTRIIASPGWWICPSPDTVTLYVDRDRLLPHTDPYSRKIAIGLGCFLELMDMAATVDGFRVTTTLFLDGEDMAEVAVRPVAVCRFAKVDVAADPLFDHEFERRSLKEPFDIERPVDTGLLETTAVAARAGTRTGFRNYPDDAVALRELTRDAFVIEFETERTYKESVDLFRIGTREVDANPDGIDFSGPMWEALRVTGLFSRGGDGSGWVFLSLGAQDGGGQCDDRDGLSPVGDKDRYAGRSDRGRTRLAAGEPGHNCDRCWGAANEPSLAGISRNSGALCAAS